MKHLLLAILCSLSLNALASDIENQALLDTILEKQEADVIARYQFRHPKQTLDFFELEPGMTVIEALPGGGWYSKILLEYLGTNGELIGVDYDLEMWSLFSWVKEDFLNDRKSWTTNWPKTAEEWAIPNAAKTKAYHFSSIPENRAGSIDTVLFIRALHNLFRFENQGEYFTNALKQAFVSLKPGGIVGVVQHETTDKQADGSKGYLHKKTLIAAFEKAGFEFVAESSVNENPNDSADGIVWRLPPIYAITSPSDPKHKEYEEIGESNRMTLKFRKPK